MPVTTAGRAGPWCAAGEWRARGCLAHTTRWASASGGDDRGRGRAPHPPAPERLPLPRSGVAVLDPSRPAPPISQEAHAQMFLLLAFIVIALVAGYVANFLVGKQRKYEPWELFVIGIVGSFVGGLTCSRSSPGWPRAAADRPHRLLHRRHRRARHLTARSATSCASATSGSDARAGAAGCGTPAVETRRAARRRRTGAAGDGRGQRTARRRMAPSDVGPAPDTDSFPQRRTDAFVVRARHRLGSHRSQSPRSLIVEGDARRVAAPDRGGVAGAEDRRAPRIGG